VIKSSLQVFTIICAKGLLVYQIAFIYYNCYDAKNEDSSHN